MNKKTNSRLWLYFTGIIFITVFLVSILLTVAWIILYRLNIISIDPQIRHMPILLLLLGSLLLGTLLALYVGKLMIRPIQNLSNAFSALSNGNFSVRMPTDEKIPEIRDMAKQFNAMTHDLSNMETLRSDFVANVSHEFKNPIATIEGYATLLQNPSLTPEKHDHYVDVILDNARRLSTLSSSILTLSKLENQEMVTDKHWFRLDEQLRRSILLLEGKWSARSIEFDIDLPKTMYFGSEALLAQVWSNILDNAIKHSPAGGTICINIQVNEHDLVVVIRDEGDGMTAEVQKHIFEKFYQSDPSRKTEGNGLGLALVKRIVELCSGTVSVESAVGQGAAFFVSLPL